MVKFGEEFTIFHWGGYLKAMQEISKMFALLGVIFLLLALLVNLGFKIPRIPGDIYIDRPGIKIYIPIVSSIIISIILTLLFNFFRK